MFSVVIVEDNPMVAMLNRKYTEKDPRFQITGEYHDAKTALEHIPANPPDLLILDVFLPPFSGLELLRELRGAGLSSDVIMVTAAGDGKTVVPEAGRSGLSGEAFYPAAVSAGIRPFLPASGNGLARQHQTVGA